MLKKSNYCVILAGGQGTRLWPFSRKSMPKQFVDVYGTGESLIMRVYDKMRKIFLPENIYVVTNRDYFDIVTKQLPDLPSDQIIKESAMKGRALTMTLAAFHIQDINPDAQVLAVPSDLRIKDEAEYLATLEDGMKYVENHDVLLTIGVTPDRPDTRYGYIQVEDEEEDGAFQVRSFTEKPEEKFARIFLESGEFYWNSGILMWNVHTYMKTVEQLLPDQTEQLKSIFANHKDPEECRALLYSCYAAFPHISADQALLEKSEHVYMLKGGFRWSDIESWDLLYDECVKDEKDNVVRASDSQLYNTHRTMAIEQNDGKLVVIDGLDDYLVVDSDNVLLICRRENEADLKKYIHDIELKSGNKYL